MNKDSIIYKMRSERVENLLNQHSVRLLPVELNQLESICTSECFTLQRLIQVAKTLFQADSEQCFKFLEYVQKTQIQRNKNNNFLLQPLKTQIFYNLAALALTKGLRQSDRQQSQKWQKQFNRYFNSGSSSVKSSGEKLYQLMHGFNSYYAGDFSKSLTNFNKLEHSDGKEQGNSILALLGQAQCYFMMRKYQKALEYYKKTLLYNKKLPTKARLGMGYCFYELEKYQLAGKCFQRILVLDPQCSPAMIALAVIKYRAGDIQEYFNLLKKAYKITPNDPLVILHLSEHFLFLGEYEKCQKLSIKGLEYLQLSPKFLKIINHHRDDYQTMKARFNNIIGQSYHARSLFEQARKYYQKAKDKGMKYNDIALAQTICQNGQISSCKQGLKILENVFMNSKPSELKLLGQFTKTIAYLQIKTQSRGSNQELNPNYYYKEALKFDKNDYQSLIEYSVYLTDLSEKKQTLKVLQSALKALQWTNREPKAQLLNNMGVSLMQDKNYEQGEKYLNKAIKIIQNSTSQNCQGEQGLKYASLFLTVNFNKAIILQLKHQYQDAIKVHRNLITFNTFYIDSYVKLGQILHNLGHKDQAFNLLNTIITQISTMKSQQLRVDKLLAIKGHLHHIDGNYSQAKQSFKKLGKIVAAYDQLYQLCLGYQLIVRKQPDKNLIKEFLRPNRQNCIIICQNDHYNAFGYMMLTILFLSDNKITKQQGLQYFNQLKIAQQEFPQIQFNYGIFALLNEEYQNALFCFNRFKEKNKTSKADQHISLTYFLKGDYNQCLNTIKKNIINEPSNLKFRYQYAYVNEKRVQKLYEEERNFKDIKTSTKHLTMCKKIYESLSRISSNDYIKTISSPEIKERVKNQLTKLRSACEDRDRFVQSQLGYYANKEKQIADKERKIREEQGRKLEEIRRAKESQKLIQELGQVDDDQDSERQRRDRRRALMQLSLKQTEEANQQWKINEEKDKEKDDQKQQKKRNRNITSKKPRRERKQNLQDKMQQELDEQSEQQFKDNNYDDEPNEYQDSQVHKKKKKKKRNRSGSEEDKKKKKKRKREKKDKDKDSNQVKDEKNSPAINNENSEMSNPFDDDKEESDKEQSDPKPRKKKVVDQDQIDLNQYVIN